MKTSPFDFASMLRYPIILLVLSMAVSCGNNEPSNTIGTSSPTSADSLAMKDLMHPFAPATQTFTASPKRPSTIEGKAGTKIHLDPKQLQMPDGSPVDSPIEVSLIECTSVADLLGAGLQTVADGKLLASGGSYYIDMRAEGQPLALREGKTMAVEFPQVVPQDMELFYGEASHTGQMNWVAADQVFEPASAEAPEATPAATDTTPLSDTLYVLATEEGTDTFATNDDLWAFLEGQGSGKKGNGSVVRNLSNEEKRKVRQRKAEEAALANQPTDRNLLNEQSRQERQRIAAQNDSAKNARLSAQQAAQRANMGMRRNFGSASPEVAAQQLNAITYGAVQIDKFGWYNCDRYMNESNRMDVIVNRPADEKDLAKVYFVSTTESSIISLEDYGSPNPLSVAVPGNSTWEVILLSKNGDGKYYYAKAKRDNNQASVSLPQGTIATEAEIKELFAQL